MPDAESIISSGLNTAMMVAFAIPGGAPAGGVIAGVEFLIELLGPKPAEVPPELRMVSQVQFSAAIERFKSQFKDILKSAEIAKTTNEVVAMTRTFQANWNEVLKAQIDKDRFDFPDDDTTDNFVTAMRLYFQLLPNAGTYHACQEKLTSIRITPADDSEASLIEAARHRNKTFGLYILTGSLAVAYLKSVIAWEWSRLVLGSLRWNQYLVAQKKWNDAPDLDHPELEPIRPAESDPIPEWQDRRTTPGGGVVQELIDQVDELVADCEGTRATVEEAATEGMYTALSKNWALVTSKANERVQQITVNDFGFGGGAFHQVVDSKTGWKSPVYDSYRAAALHEVMAGTAIAYESARWIRASALEEVEATDIAKFGDAIETWKQIRESVMFKTHVCRDGDAYDAIANKLFSDEERGEWIYKVNRDKIPESRVVTVGLQLLIPDIRGKFFSSYGVKSGDTLDSIGHSRYPDQYLAKYIYEKVQDQVTAAGGIKRGLTLKVPDPAARF